MSEPCRCVSYKTAGVEADGTMETGEWFEGDVLDGVLRLPRKRIIGLCCRRMRVARMMAVGLGKGY